MKGDFISISTLGECVAAVFDVAPRDLHSMRRPHELTLARQALYLLASELTQFSSATIGRQIGARDHTTILYGVKAAKDRCNSDPDYAFKVDVARRAASTIAHSSLERLLQDPDVIAVAERVCRDPMREAMSISTLETAAMAARLLDLEDAAAFTFQLLSRIDEMSELPLATDADCERRHELALSIKAITESLSSQLATLGYNQEKLNVEVTEEKNAGYEPTRAANAG